jgi:hypothetical protein
VLKAKSAWEHDQTVHARFDAGLECEIQGLWVWYLWDLDLERQRAGSRLCPREVGLRIAAKIEHAHASGLRYDLLE